MNIIVRESLKSAKPIESVPDSLVSAVHSRIGIGNVQEALGGESSFEIVGVIAFNVRYILNAKNHMGYVPLSNYNATTMQKTTN